MKQPPTVMRDPRELKNSVYNIALGGDQCPENLVKGIRANGIRQPIILAKSKDPELDGCIVSGRRRLAVAMMLGLTEVPTISLSLQDSLDFEDASIDYNTWCPISIEDRLRLGERQMEIRTVREANPPKAKKAARISRSKNLENSNGHVKRGRPAKSKKKGDFEVEAAKEVGLSRTTLQRGGRVIKKIDQLVSEGRTEEAEQIRTTLNTKSVEAALREVQAVDSEETGNKITNPETRAIHRQVMKMKSAMAVFDTARDECVKACDAKNRNGRGFGLRFGKMIMMLRVLYDATKAPKAKTAEIVAEWGKALEEMDR